ncbi:MAG: hypothetical protein RQ751_07330 [Longimicrobiales bacterium]|nr:hypothetical protein [Longimicrobiales bacterium]
MRPPTSAFRAVRPPVSGALAALFLAALAGLAPSGAAGQGIGVGAHVGLNGFGVDGALGLSPRVVLRGGISIAPDDYFLTSILPEDISDVEYDLLLPRTTLRAGLDLHVLGPLRLMGGVLYRSDDLEATADVDQSIELGGTTFNRSGTVTARLEQNSLLPYAGIGLGKLTSGFGFYLDLGVAYSGEADIVMTATGDLAAEPGIQQALQDEADEFFDDTPNIVKRFYPILQIGVKVGVGR